MKDVETLLNTLIARGWKPWGLDANKIEHITTKRFSVFYDQKGLEEQMLKNIRELVSLESGLWQFVVEQKLYKETNIVYDKYIGADHYRNYYNIFYEYRLLESALVPEEGLAKFLVDNIEVKCLEQ